MDNKQKISREKFLQICGSLIAGGSIVGLLGFLLSRNVVIPDKNQTCAADSIACSSCGVSNCSLRR